MRLLPKLPILRLPLTRLVGHLAPSIWEAKKVLLLSVLAVLSWTVPPRHWRGLCLALATRRPGNLANRRVSEAGAIPRFLTDLTGATPRAAADYSTSIAYEEALQIFRLHRPGCWQPSIEVIGIGNLEAAVGSGNGALIWNAFAFSIITKMGLKQEGFPLNYLSRPEHGFYPMDVGKFRGIVQRAENRYLASRVIIRRKLAVDAMRVSVALLAANRVVGIAYGDQASQLISVPLLAGMLQVPTGPLNLSRLTKAPILPTFTIQETSERFRVEINPPIPMPEGVSRHDQLSSAAREYASVLERYIRRYPHLWNGWQLYWSEDRSAQLDG